MKVFRIYLDGFAWGNEFETREDAEQYIVDHPILWKICQYTVYVDSYEKN